MDSKGPIFVTADEPLIIFRSADNAIGYLEWQDVEEGLYRGYDAEGRLIQFGAKESPRRWGFLPRPKSVVYTAEAEPAHAEELRAILIRVLSSDAPDGRDMEAASLGELEELAVGRFGMTH